MPKSAQDKVFDEPQKAADFKFGANVVSVFDDMVTRSVPFYLEMQRMMTEIAADFAVPGTHVYDLGCSTGTTLINLDKVLPQDVKFIGIDDSNLAFNLTWHDWLNLRSLCDVSEVITKAGIARENSRGAHFREDFPDPGAMEDSDFTVARMDGDTVEVTREPVNFSIVRPGETILPKGAPETLVG